MSKKMMKGTVRGGNMEDDEKLCFLRKKAAIMESIVVYKNGREVDILVKIDLSLPTV